jgi:hypothetical protein
MQTCESGWVETLAPISGPQSLVAEKRKLFFSVGNLTSVCPARSPSLYRVGLNIPEFPSTQLLVAASLKSARGCGMQMRHVRAGYTNIAYVMSNIDIEQNLTECSLKGHEAVST